jgi:hypothetical protein
MSLSVDNETSQNKEVEVEEEEETFVLIQFTDQDDAKYCQQFSDQFKSIQLDNKNPIIQIGNRLYQGEYENNIGTYLFFEEKSSNNSNNIAASTNINSSLSTSNSNQNNNNNLTSNTSTPSANNYNYFSKSYKKLILNRLFVEEKNDQEK